MPDLLDNVLAVIRERNPMHAKKLDQTLGSQPDTYRRFANDFLQRYVDFATAQGKDLAFGIDSYLRMCADVLIETVRFIESGTYSSTSFAEVHDRVYANPEVMEYYMHGLLLSQVLWLHHYRLFTYFSESLRSYAGDIKAYLEIGGGHGLFIREAVRQLGDKATIDVVDISPSSIAMAKAFVGDARVNYTLADIHDYNPQKSYDFITMGEVLEHVEDPVRLLTKLRDLLAPSGRAFISTPANAPAIDHIYLFTSVDDIRSVIARAGFSVVDELYMYAEDVDEATARDQKVAIMYGAFIEPH